MIMKLIFAFTASPVCEPPHRAGWSGKKSGKDLRKQLVGLLSAPMKHPALLAVLFLGCAHQSAPAPAPAPAAPAPLGVEAAGKLHGFLHKLKCGDRQDDRSCKLSPDQERSRTDVVLAGD